MYQNCDGTFTNGVTLEICLGPFPEPLLGLVVLLGALMVFIWAMGGLDQAEEQKEEV